jgi:PAS domain S-box-containing protein
MVPTTQSAADLTQCESEPIRFPGAVQPHGALLVIDPATACVVAASESCAAILALPAARLLGLPLSSVVGAGAADLVMAAAQTCSDPTPPVPLLQAPYLARARTNDRGLVLVDIEAMAAGDDAAAHAFRHATGQLRRIQGLMAIAGQGCEDVRRILGFDRVMVYRFDSDWHGEVIGEARAPHVEPFLGLHYPASDIPQQARALYRLCKVRQIPDVGYLPSALLTAAGVGPIDLGRSSLRSVSPAHIEYCHNMGVKASLVGSLVIDDRLWGLVACHHCAGPLPVSPGLREDFAGFCEDIASVIETDLLKQEKARALDLAARRVALVSTIRAHDFRGLIRRREGQEVMDVVGADGFALIVDGTIERIGHTPDVAQVLELQARRRARAPERALFATSRLESDLGPGVAARGVAGALFVSVPQKPGMSMVWFRDERAHHVRWGGDPAHAHTLEADGRLSPRKSFAQFLQEVRGQSLPWTTAELAAAADLGSLIEIDALRQREAFTKTVLDSSPEQMCVLDAQGVVVSVNQAWVRFAMDNGAREGTAEPVGISYRAICSAAEGECGGEEGPAAWQGIADVLAGLSHHFTLDYPCDSPTERRWFQMNVYPMQAPCEGAVVLHTNITARKLAELALQASEQRYRTVLDGQTDLICRFKVDGTIVFVNAAFCDFFGKPADTLIGHRWQPVVVAEDLPQVQAALARVSPESPVVTIENRVHARGGELRWGQFVNRAFFDEHGQLIEFQVVARDVTERRRLDERLAQKSEDLARSNRDLERFAYVAAHDLQEPLRMVNSYGQLLIRRYGGQLDTEAQEFLNFMVDGGRRAQALIRALLTLAQLDTQAQPMQAVALDEVLDHVLVQLRQLIGSSGAAITRDALPTVTGDARQLGQLLSNLIVNAIKFRASAAPELHVGASRSKGCWYITVSDNGIGIAAQYFDRIFVIFQRLNLRSEHEGTGIGLAICQRVVERHGGKIGVASEPGRGSIFHFTLPEPVRVPSVHAQPLETR